ncbi:hypothetical protein LZ32DRAFT_133912 [Colletotrichum eremochloae]|nr:hypothetical protein LZ32DRAFT_133912 [Colletotrichum eremochloae]
MAVQGGHSSPNGEFPDRGRSVVLVAVECGRLQCRENCKRQGGERICARFATRLRPCRGGVSDTKGVSVCVCVCVLVAASRNAASTEVIPS